MLHRPDLRETLPGRALALSASSARHSCISQPGERTCALPSAAVLARRAKGPRMRSARHCCVITHAYCQAPLYQPVWRLPPRCHRAGRRTDQFCGMGPQHRFDMGGMGPPFLPRDMTAGSKSSGMLAAKTGTTELYCLRFFWVNKSARDRIGKIIIVKIITISCPPHLYPRTQPRISWHERGAPAAKFHPPPVQTFSPHPKFQPPPVETFTLWAQRASMEFRKNTNNPITR